MMKPQVKNSYYLQLRNAIFMSTIITSYCLIFQLQLVTLTEARTDHTLVLLLNFILLVDNISRDSMKQRRLFRVPTIYRAAHTSALLSEGRRNLKTPWLQVVLIMPCAASIRRVCGLI